MNSIRIMIVAVLLAMSLGLATASSTGNSIREYRVAHEHQIFNEFVDLLAIPNVASDRANIRRNAARIMEMMEQRGLKPQLLELGDPAVPPAVYGEFKSPGATHTLVFYAHYDGQPVDPSQWTASPPWQPTVRSAAVESGGTVLPLPKNDEKINPEWRIYARSASDDKLGVMAILAAFQALKVTQKAPTYNIKFYFEGEEEAGSPHLGELVSKYKDLLAADAWIMCDGPVHQTGRKQVVFGARGVTGVDITVYGGKRPLHSGHYGNWAPNPAMMLARLLASMKDDNGRVTIQGFYDDVEPLGAAERKALSEIPDVDNDLKTQFGFSHPEGAGKSLSELINQPSLNIDGFRSADVGLLARNVIPTTATATIDMRLVKGNDAHRQVTRLIEHIRKQGYYVVDHEPTDAERRDHPLIANVKDRGGYNAERTSMDLPISKNVINAVQSVSDQPIVKLPTLGGSLPLYILKQQLGATTITIPLANFDNNQHAENENVRIQNLWDGIEIMAAIMTMNQ
ncbi:MAG TPA: M20/M25/M40 family metallo-hydrolase [Blastocatellia bacterium]|nr:M20/M25/M40 family metallo-hydrolase [Blastocatellia bacterium]